MSCLGLEAVVTRLFRSMAERCSLQGRESEMWRWDGFGFCLPSRVMMKIRNVFVIFGSRLGGYSQLGKVLMLALVLVLVLDPTGFFRRILIRLGQA
jgi:hypothetical protein